MNPISQVQKLQTLPPVNSAANKESAKLEKKLSSSDTQEILQPVLNKMSKQLNENSKVIGSEISAQQAQQLVPNEGVMMMGAQSANITAEFVANLLNKSPYERA